MHTCSWHSSLNSKTASFLGFCHRLLTSAYRQNPAVIAAAQGVFVSIVLALEAETIQGATAQRVAAAGKNVVQAAGLDANRVLSTMRPETQHTVRGYFA